MTQIKDSFGIIVGMTVLGSLSVPKDYTVMEWLLSVALFLMCVIVIETVWPKGYKDVPVTYENLDYLAENTAWSREELEQMLAMIQFRQVEMAVPVKKKAWRKNG